MILINSPTIPIKNAQKLTIRNSMCWNYNIKPNGDSKWIWFEIHNAEVGLRVDIGKWERETFTELKVK